MEWYFPARCASVESNEVVLNLYCLVWRWSAATVDCLVSAGRCRGPQRCRGGTVWRSGGVAVSPVTIRPSAGLNLLRATLSYYSAGQWLSAIPMDMLFSRSFSSRLRNERKEVVLGGDILTYWVFSIFVLVFCIKYVCTYSVFHVRCVEIFVVCVVSISFGQQDC